MTKEETKTTKSETTPEEETWAEVTPELEDTWDFEAQATLIGKYTNMKEDVGPNGSKMHYFQLADGTEVAVWGTTVLDGRLKEVSIGDMVKIEYKGKVKSEKTQREYRDFGVFFKPSPFEEVK